MVRDAPAIKESCSSTHDALEPEVGSLDPGHVCRERWTQETGGGSAHRGIGTGGG